MLKKNDTFIEKCLRKHGGSALLTFADKGFGGVNNCNKFAYVILERPLRAGEDKRVKSFGGRLYGKSIDGVNH